MKTLRTLMMFMALSNTALFAANFMHYHPEDRLCRAQAEPIETVGDQDMVLETITGTRLCELC